MAPYLVSLSPLATIVHFVLSSNVATSLSKKKLANNSNQFSYSIKWNISVMLSELRTLYLPSFSTIWSILNSIAFWHRQRCRFVSASASTFITLCLSTNHLSLFLHPFKFECVFASSSLYIQFIVVCFDELKSFTICKRQRHMDNLLSISL